MVSAACETSCLCVVLYGSRPGSVTVGARTDPHVGPRRRDRERREAAALLLPPEVALREVGADLAQELLLVDALRMHFRSVRLRKDPEWFVRETGSGDELAGEALGCRAVP